MARAKGRGRRHSTQEASCRQAGTFLPTAFVLPPFCIRIKHRRQLFTSELQGTRPEASGSSTRERTRLAT